MRYYTLRLNGLYYGGESLDEVEGETVHALHGGLGRNGFHHYGSARQFGKLIWRMDSPHKLYGHRGINGAMQRVIDRIDAGISGIYAGPVKIEIEGYEE